MIYDKSSKNVKFSDLI